MQGRVSIAVAAAGAATGDATEAEAEAEDEEEAEGAFLSSSSHLLSRTARTAAIPEPRGSLSSASSDHLLSALLAAALTALPVAPLERRGLAAPRAAGEPESSAILRSRAAEDSQPPCTVLRSGLAGPAAVAALTLVAAVLVVAAGASAPLIFARRAIAAFARISAAAARSSIVTAFFTGCADGTIEPAEASPPSMGADASVVVPNR